MRRPIKRNRHKLALESQRIANLALAVGQSTSRYEDQCWQTQLDVLVAKNLRQHHQDVVDAAAEHLFQTHSNGYEVLIDTLESTSSSVQLDHQGQLYDVLLIAAPVLAWTRFEIAACALADEVCQNLSAQLRAALLTDTAKINLLPQLYAIDQLPRSHSEIYALLERQAQALLKGGPAATEAKPPQAVPFLADTRYLLAVVAAPAGSAIFRWQALESPFDSIAAKTLAQSQWQQASEDVFKRLLPGCGIELLLPDAYYAACREADVRIRPASIRAAVFYLSHTLGIEADKLTAVIGAFGEQEESGQIDEYRIGFCQNSAPEVLYGVVWPLYHAEDQANALSIGEDGQPGGEIANLLAEAGVTSIVRHEDIYAMEFCDDCGAPLFPDREGELCHAEMPEDAPQPGSTHFH